MSCYEWERGTIKIPAAEWAAFRKGLIQKWNEQLEKDFDLACKAHDAAKAAAKGKRGDNRTVAMLDAVARLCDGKWDPRWNFYEGRNRDLFDRIDAQVFKRVWDAQGRNLTRTLTKPKKSALEILPVTKGATLHIGEASITLDNETKTVTWDVPENNHAVETARAHWMAKHLFFALDRIKWTARSGGKIVGNNEYNRDSANVGGGGNYLVQDYRKLSPKEKKAFRQPAKTCGYTYY